MPEEVKKRMSITATVLEAALEVGVDRTPGSSQAQAPEGGAGTFEPVIVKKRQRRLSDVDAVAILLDARGLTTGEISAHFAEVCGASISKHPPSTTPCLQPPSEPRKCACPSGAAASPPREDRAQLLRSRDRCVADEPAADVGRGPAAHERTPREQRHPRGIRHALHHDQPR